MTIGIGRRAGRTLLALAVAGLPALAHARGDGRPSDAGAGYRNGRLGTLSHGRVIPNTHNPNRFIHGPGVVVRH